MSSLRSNEPLDPIFEREDLIEGLKVIWFVINNFFFEFRNWCWFLDSFTKYYWGDWALDYVCTQFRDFTKISSFSWTRYLVHSVYSDNDLVLFHLWWKETRLTYEKLKVSKCIVSGVVLLKLVCFNLCWNSDYELGFYSNQFWGLPTYLFS